jgi:hypothetical protein
LENLKGINTALLDSFTDINHQAVDLELSFISFTDAGKTCRRVNNLSTPACAIVNRRGRLVPT